MTASRRAFPGWSVPDQSWAGAVAYHALRWLPLVCVAVLTYLIFPLPGHITAPAVRVGEIADQTITAPFYFVVTKSDAERALEGEARAMAARPVYRFDAAAYDSVMVQVDTLFANLDVAAQDGVEEVQQTAGTVGARLGRAEGAYLLDRSRRLAVKAALASFLRGTLSQGVADGGRLRGDPSRYVSLRRGDVERVIPRDSILTFPDLMARAEDPGAGVSDEVGRRIVRQLTAALYRPTIVPDPLLTNMRREQLRASVDTVKYAVPAGERIVVAGQAVSQEARDKLIGLRNELHRRGEDAVVARSVAGGLLYNAIILATFWVLILLYRPESYAQLREMVFFGVLFGLVVLLSGALTRVFPWRPELIPIPFAAILLTVLYSGRVGLVGAVTLAILRWALP